MVTKLRRLAVGSAAAIGLVALMPLSAPAQFLPGSIVFDPSSWATLGHIWTEDISTGQKIIQEILQLTKIYNNAVQLYNQVEYNATAFQNKAAWRGIGTLIVNTHVGTLYGETAGWDQAATAGMNIGGAWQEATYQINPPIFYSTAAIGNSSLSALIASINVADGISQGSLQAIANARMNHPMNDIALSNLESAAMDTGLGTNSEIEQLNLLTTGAVLTGRQGEINTALLTQIAEQQLVQNKMQRDAAADNINVMGVRDNYLALEPTQWGGSAATIAEYRQ